MEIKDLKNPWRKKYGALTRANGPALAAAAFRGAYFHVETDTRAGGRRVALHQYPKRNVPYAEDMGRTANRFVVQGYLIGPNYLDMRDALIEELEKDGPGQLRLPLPYRMSDVTVVVQSYTVTESRERGGFCTIDMDFIEYGDPQYRQTVSTPEQVNSAATKTEDELIGPPTPQLQSQAAPYSQVYASANISGVAVSI
jgi:prophage DNA circulation protein